MTGSRIRSRLKNAGKETGKCLGKVALQGCKIALWVCCSPCLCCAMVFLPRRRGGCCVRTRNSEPTRPPMPFPRQRALTILSTTEWQEDQFTLDQPQSAFMTKLPLEIRRIVYEKVLGERSVHLGLVNGNIHARRCPNGHCQCGNIEPYLERKLEFGLPFLRTCRQIYSESVEYLYTSNYFSLSTDFEQLPTIQYMSYHMLPQRLELIRNLYIYWEIDSELYFMLNREVDSVKRQWLKSWDALSKLTGLRRLRINLIFRFSHWADSYEELWRDSATELLEPIKMITAPREFIITLPDHRCSTDVDVGSSSCVFKLPEEHNGSDNSTDAL